MKKKAKGKKREVVLEVEPQTLSPAERSFELILQRERTPYLNDEGYHFIRPAWHRYVYGGGKKDDK